jgi:hypothetical protein
MDLSSPGADRICGPLQWRPGLLSAKGCFGADCGYKGRGSRSGSFLFIRNRNGLLFQGMPQQAIDYADLDAWIASNKHGEAA